MQNTLMVNGIECKTVGIDGLWNVIVGGVPQILYRGWKNKKGYRNGRQQTLKLKSICVACNKEFLGGLIL